MRTLWDIVQIVSAIDLRVGNEYDGIPVGQPMRKKKQTFGLVWLNIELDDP